MEKKQKKQCTKCNKVFPITAFHRNCNRKDGRDDGGDGEETRVSREAPQVAQKSVSDGYVFLQNQVGVGRKTNNRQIKAVYSAREVGLGVP